MVNVAAFYDGPAERAVRHTWVSDFAAALRDPRQRAMRTVGGPSGLFADMRWKSVSRITNPIEGIVEMTPADYSLPPTEGFVLTHFLVVADQDRSREFYRNLFDGQVLRQRDPVVIQVANSWIILNVGGGPTDDKPTVTLTTPPDAHRTSAFLNVRVADIAAAYQEWSARGAQFLTEPQDRGAEIRAYIRDPDGHLIEVGQTTATIWTSEP
jgi:lactoylglutathione lyase